VKVWNAENGSPFTTGHGNPKLRPSRADVETVCLLYAIPDIESSAGDVAATLGLDPELGATVLAACEVLIASSWVLRNGDRVARTEAGRAWLEARLDELDVGERGRRARKKQ
jgi:hypothetical protein